MPNTVPIEEGLRECVRKRCDALTPGWRWVTVVIDRGDGVPAETVVVKPAEPPVTSGS